MPVVPMFPLGTVLVPGAVIPLHVFEPRYRQLTRDCLADDLPFGIVLIERGPEVGGGDVRTDVGTMARIFQADEQPDGRWALVVVGTTRIRVTRWLADDPYPRAEVVDWLDEHDPSPPTTGTADGGWEAVAIRLRRAAALLRELGQPAPPLDLELEDDPVVASYQASALAQMGPIDRQMLLECPTVEARQAALTQLLDDQIEFLNAQLADG